MNTNRELLTIMAKTGVYFARLNDEIGPKESAAITSFLKNMKEDMEIDIDVDQLLVKLAARNITLDEVVSLTKDYLGSFNEFEKKSLLNSISKFIETVIKADGIETLEEKQEYLFWQQRLGFAPIDITQYQDNYSEDRFWNKLAKCAKKAGLKVVYSALLLYYVATDSSVPMNIRITIFGALGYLILPLDLIPDFIPGAGFTDDLGALLAVYSLVKSHVTPEVEKKSKAKLSDWFGVFDEKDLVL